MRGFFRRQDDVCPWYLAYTFDNPLRKFIHNPPKLFGPYLKPGMHAADIGAGMGYFSMGMARIVGDTGKIYSIDLQQKMLNTLKKRAAKAKLDHIIELHKCEQETLAFKHKIDFALACWVVHEVPDPARLFSEIHKALKPQGYLFTAEPIFHVSQGKIDQMCEHAADQGFVLHDCPQFALSKALVFKKV